VGQRIGIVMGQLESLLVYLKETKQQNNSDTVKVMKALLEEVKSHDVTAFIIRKCLKDDDATELAVKQLITCDFDSLMVHWKKKVVEFQGSVLSSLSTEKVILVKTEEKTYS